MLTLNGQQAAQAPQNTQQRYYGYGRGYDQGYAQLAANNRAIVNTQVRIIAGQLCVQQHLCNATFKSVAV